MGTGESGALLILRKNSEARKCGNWKKIGSSGIESKKNKKNVKRKNLAKAGVHKVIEKYLENGGFQRKIWKNYSIF